MGQQAAHQKIDSGFERGCFADHRGVWRVVPMACKPDHRLQDETRSFFSSRRLFVSSLKDRCQANRPSSAVKTRSSHAHLKDADPVPRSFGDGLRPYGFSS
jgi:hypothetical protein